MGSLIYYTCQPNLPRTGRPETRQKAGTQWADHTGWDSCPSAWSRRPSAGTETRTPSRRRSRMSWLSGAPGQPTRISVRWCLTCLVSCWSSPWAVDSVPDPPLLAPRGQREAVHRPRPARALWPREVPHTATPWHQQYDVNFYHWPTNRLTDCDGQTSRWHEFPGIPTTTTTVHTAEPWMTTGLALPDPRLCRVWWQRGRRVTRCTRRGGWPRKVGARAPTRQCDPHQQPEKRQRHDKNQRILKTIMYNRPTGINLICLIRSFISYS